MAILELQKIMNMKKFYNNRYNKPEFNKGYKKDRKEDLSEVIKRRNKRLQDFFRLCGLSIRLIGDESKPAIILDDKYILNAYVHNFELRFTDNPFQGNTIYTVKLSENPNFDKNKIISCINDYEKRLVYKVTLGSVNGINLFLSGYNFLNKEEKVGRYPVFSAYAPKVFFTKEKADEVASELNNDGYKLTVI